MQNDLLRQASHSGSWYSAAKEELKSQLKTFIINSKCFSETNKILKSVIVPHAGYRYSGPTASWSYININKSLYKRVVVLGPSHHSYFEGCGLSKFSSIETPLGNLKIDNEMNKILKKKLHFQEIDNDVDEEEHSLEMQYPFLKYMFDEEDVLILPIMVGEIDLKIQEEIAETLLDLYKEKSTLFVISSDFCHWGKRFRYTYYDKNSGKIFQSIENLDKMGMDAIESMNPRIFSDYLISYKNTICGRKPISILLSLINRFNRELNLNANIKVEENIDFSSVDNFIKFIQYNQSSKVVEENDSSVSYAAGLNYVDEKFLL